jgi:hypothetical protein
MLHVIFVKLNQEVYNVAIKIQILRVVTYVKLSQEVKLAVNLILLINHVIYVL